MLQPLAPALLLLLVVQLPALLLLLLVLVLVQPVPRRAQPNEYQSSQAVGVAVLLMQKALQPLAQEQQPSLARQQAVLLLLLATRSFLSRAH
jgi:hypothetical protein